MAYNVPGDVPTGYMNELQTLRDQWEQLVGYSAPITDSMLKDMANTGVIDLTQMAGWMRNAPGALGSSAWTQYPWAMYGMTRNQYVQTMNEYVNTWETLTGQTTNAANPFFDWGLENGMSASDMSTAWQNSAMMQQTYGWLKYNMNYQQFQAQKMGMTQAFGRQLNDSEALQQLEYWHTNQGSNQSASVEPTFTQIEKKAASTGVAGPGTVVR